MDRDNRYTIQRLEDWLLSAGRHLRDLNDRMKWNKEEGENLKGQIKEQEEMIKDLQINLDILRGKKVEL